MSGVRGDRSRAGTSQDVESPPQAGSSDVEVRLDATLVLVERSEFPGCGKPVFEILGRLLTLTHPTPCIVAGANHSAQRLAQVTGLGGRIPARPTR